MAAKDTVHYLCSECGWSGSKWYGRCPECKEWGTVNEFREPIASPGVSRASRSSATRRAKVMSLASTNGGNATAQPISEITTDTSLRISTGFTEFDRVLGGGIVAGSVTLVAGEPGIGKSTLLLQTAGNVAQALSEKDANVLYISGEESTTQVKIRASRIHCIDEHLLLASTTSLANVLALIEQYRPTLAIVDSAQTIVSEDVDGITGGSTQVREVASALIDIAKTHNIPIMLVGHVTKDGSIAGPRTLEHLVDTVCQFEGETQTALRLIRAIKNRFGPTDEVGCFDMSGEGIEEVPDPSGLFLSSHMQHVEGTCVTFTLEGHRSLPIEIQALVTKSALPTPRRAVSGADPNRIAMLTAVLYRHGHINILGNDLYVSTIAGAVAKEPSCDLAICVALASATLQKPIAESTCVIGEISLTGQIRPVPRLQARLREAARLGYRRVICCPTRGNVSVDGLEMVTVQTLREAFSALGLTRQ